jgi:hypothetical protein
MEQEKIKMYSRTNRPGRHELTEDDILDIQSEFFIDVSEEVIRKAFAPSEFVSVGEQRAVLHLGRQWGWDDTVTREDFAELIVNTKAAPAFIFD